MSFLKTKESGEAQVDFDRLPRHVAIIMDGNGRWAKRRGLPRTAGHAAGAETFRSIATYCQKIGLEYLTVYAFSTENWKRPLEEVSAIVGLLKKYLLESIEKMEKAGGRKPEELTEVLFSEYLCSNGVPDPDLVIRPSGEVRISNFLLWQSAYAEFYFTDVLWPDFSKEELHRALAAYQGRSRRFGGV